MSGTLQLETDDLRFRGPPPLKIPLSSISAARAEGGALHITWEKGTAAFELGAAAEKWADSINNPKSLLDKLGVKAEHTVSALGITDQAFLSDLQRRTPHVTLGKAVKNSDLILLQADQPAELDAIAELAKQIQPAGALWVITPKKRPEIADTVVMKAGRAAGLVDVKVARFSETHTTLKFVMPKSKR